MLKTINSCKFVYSLTDNFDKPELIYPLKGVDKSINNDNSLLWEDGICVTKQLQKII